MGFTDKAWRWVHLGVVALMSAASPAHAADTSYGRVIVRLKPNASVLRSSVVQVQSTGTSAQAQVMQRLGQRRGLIVQDGREVGPHVHVAMAQGMSSDALAAVLAKDSDVLYAVPDRLRQLHSVYPNDPLFSDVANPNVAVGQWFLRAPDATIVSAINAQPAWASVTGNGITVAEIDSGVRKDHPDLVNKLHAGYNMITYASVSGVQGGRSADSSDLGDWVVQSDIDAISAELHAPVDCKLEATSAWHGTKVAGIIGAETNNGIGGASVAPAAMILPVRALGKCGGWDSDIIAGMRWAAGEDVGTGPDRIAAPPDPARVINMSLGGADTCSQAYKDAIAEITARNVVIVASAGNDNGLAVSTPANCPGVIAVGGLRHAGTKVGYSSLGPEVSLSAPAGNCANGDTGPCLYTMLTTTNSGTTTPVTNANGGSIYTDQVNLWANGTSFAAPQVSGAAALLLEARPSLTPAAVSSLLRRHARAFPTSGDALTSGSCVAPSAAEQLVCYCTTQTCGAGMLDVDAAVQAALTDPVAVITVNPSTQATPLPNQPVYLSAAQSMVSPVGASIASYTWQLLSDGGIVNATGWSSSSAETQLTPTGSGAFKVRLQVQDDMGRSAYIDQWVYVAASAPVTNTSASSGGGGGGGSVDGGSLAALALATLVLSLPRARRQFRAGA
ncbi:MAG: S8 family serine peptidase [Aquabacterium sp.]|uniref:S8 family serine peptidase n=1 Tax=Aquabacterium sp. TaxID=1872578 RepID=UPI0025BE5FF8|nr:S8 family serine peptidase [Aquabacterium sp.]MBI3380756.1 S8 family serine peptidase [Aquabacterium sp.]